MATLEFYDGDWCGVIECDMVMEAWCPVLWYNRETQGMTETRLKELEDTCSLDRWVDALYACKPVIIPDTTLYKTSNSEEYEIYRRLNADAVLAVPFWKNPTGFLIVRNPKKIYIEVVFFRFWHMLYFPLLLKRSYWRELVKHFHLKILKKIRISLSIYLIN